MDATTLRRTDDDPAGPVRWEPCAEPEPDGPLCAACGWPLDDHGRRAA